MKLSGAQFFYFTKIHKTYFLSEALCPVWKNINRSSHRTSICPVSNRLILKPDCPVYRQGRNKFMIHVHDDTWMNIELTNKGKRNFSIKLEFCHYRGDRHDLRILRHRNRIIFLRRLMGNLEVIYIYYIYTMSNVSKQIRKFFCMK